MIDTISDAQGASSTGYEQIARQYYATWLCVPPSTLDETRTSIVISPSRDQVIPGHSTPIPLYAMVREQQVIVALGRAFAVEKRVVASKIEADLQALSAPEITQQRIDALLRTAGLEIGEWSIKYQFVGPSPSVPEAKATCLNLSDYARYEAFYRRMHPEQTSLDWLQLYFESIARRRLTWGVAADGDLVAVTDAPSVPYMEDSIIEIGINTHPDYRRRGFAKVACQAMIREILDQRMVPVWSCLMENIASRNLATSIGFRSFGCVATMRA